MDTGLTDCARWLEWEQGSRGRRQLTWSQGLREWARLGANTPMTMIFGRVDVACTSKVPLFQRSPVSVVASARSASGRDPACDTTPTPSAPGGQLHQRRRVRHSTVAELQEHHPKIGLHRRGRPTDPRIEERHKRGEEHRIVQQHIDAGQPGRQHQQLRRQQRLPQRHRIVSSVRCGRRSTATVNVARRKRSCPCSKPLATCCPIVLTYGRSLCWSGRPVRGKRTISRILERLVGRGNSTELEGFRSPRLQPPPPPDLAYPQT